MLVFVGNVSLAEIEFGWKPIVNPSHGVKKLYNWVIENRHLFE